MLIDAKRLVDRLRHPRSRADDLASLRRRFADAPSPEQACPEAVALAAELRQRREALAASFTEVEECRGCARGHPPPAGRWDGGHCCSGPTEGVFTDTEIAALRLGGTRADDLAAPRSDHAGCAFRGPEGCSLSPVDRPNICVRYVCVDLERELREGGQLPEVREQRIALATAFVRFAKLVDTPDDEEGSAEFIRNFESFRFNPLR